MKLEQSNFDKDKDMQAFTYSLARHFYRCSYDIHHRPGNEKYSSRCHIGTVYGYRKLQHSNNNQQLFILTFRQSAFQYNQQPTFKYMKLEQPNFDRVRICKSLRTCVCPICVFSFTHKNLS